MEKIKSLKTFFSDRNNIIGVLLVLIGLFFLFPHFFVRPLTPLPKDHYLENSVDISWIATLNYASIKDMVWGKDFAFTYGPLGFLGMRTGWGVSKYWILLYDLFYLFNIASIFFLSYKRSVNKWLAALFILSAILILPTFPASASALALFMFLIFWINQSIGSPRPLYYIMQALLVAILFYTKFNTGLIAIVLFYSGLLYPAIAKKEKLAKLLAWGLAPLAMIAILAIVLNVYIPGYIRAALEIVAGYTQTMFYSDPELVPLFMFVGILAIGALVVAALKFFSEKGNKLQNAIRYFIFFVSFFILYKQSFVRMDIYHASEFFKFALLLMLCASFFTSFRPKSIATAVVLIMLGTGLYANFNYLPEQYRGFTGKLNKSAYFQQFKSFDDTNGATAFLPNDNGFPDRIKKKIGNAETDMYPWNAYMMFENNLNYVPRPIMQSYTAYTQYLENLNFEHYNSGSAPKYVLYDYLGHDARYPLFDEPKLNVVLLKSYTAIDSFSLNSRNILLLERKKNPKPVKFEFIREYAMYVNAPILPKKDIYYEVGIYNDLEGKFKSIILHDPLVWLEIETNDGKKTTHRTSAALLGMGVFSQVLVEKPADFYKLIKNDSIDDSLKVKKYSIRPQEGCIKEKIRIKEYKIIN